MHTHAKYELHNPNLKGKHLQTILFAEPFTNLKWALLNHNKLFCAYHTKSV